MKTDEELAETYASRIYRNSKGCAQGFRDTLLNMARIGYLAGLRDSRKYVFISTLRRKEKLRFENEKN